MQKKRVKCNHYRNKSGLTVEMYVISNITDINMFTKNYKRHKCFKYQYTSVQYCMKRFRNYQ